MFSFPEAWLKPDAQYRHCYLTELQVGNSGFLSAVVFETTTHQAESVTQSALLLQPGNLQPH